MPNAVVVVAHAPGTQVEDALEAGPGWLDLVGWLDPVERLDPVECLDPPGVA